MATVLKTKYKTFKAKKRSSSASSPSTSPLSPKIDNGSSTPTKNYAAFLADLVAAFNSISVSSSSPQSSSSSSVANDLSGKSSTTARTKNSPLPPTPAPVLHTSFEGYDHEIHVDGRQKSKLIKAFQAANPDKVNEIIKLLKAMPDPTKLSSVPKTTVNATPPAPPSVPPKPKAIKNASDSTSTGKWGSLKVESKRLGHSRDSSRHSFDSSGKKKQKQDATNQEESDAIEDLQEWDKLEKSWWTSWETQKSNDQATGVELGIAAAASESTTAPSATTSASPSSSRWWSSPTTEKSQTKTMAAANTPSVVPPKPPAKDAIHKLNKHKSTPDLKRTSSTGFSLTSLFTKSDPSVDNNITSSAHSTTANVSHDGKSKKKHRHEKDLSSASSNTLTTGEQIARAAAAMLAAAAVSKPKNPPTNVSVGDAATAIDTNETKEDVEKKKSLRKSASMSLRTTTLKGLLLPTQKTSLVDTSAMTVKNKKVSPTPLTPVTPVAAAGATSDVSANKKTVTIKKPIMSVAAANLPPPPPSFVVKTIHTFTNGLMSPFLLLQQIGVCPPEHLISAYTFWWGYEIYIPHQSMNMMERVSNTSAVFFGLLSGALAAIPGLACLVPIAKIIATWVGFQWQAIKSQDVGKGVVVSATWVLPVALASRSWDQGDQGDKPLPLAPMAPMLPGGNMKSGFPLFGF
ncbi:hypothetical protein BGZ83_001925 [Gryganskiella cystojenkinii]|nr:hypothetical protein BGZ83_001925 [Gryganskiella cystojenkinii]